jgi:hypothetical protein
MSDMPVAIFYHVYPVNNWKNLVQKQVGHMMNSSLWDTADYKYVGLNGEENFPIKVDRVEINSNTESEMPTLLALWDFAKTNPDFKILYIHTKGVTCNSYNVELWRLYLEYFTVTHWKKCVDLLDVYDCVGTEWMVIASLNNPVQVPPHYSGNFWWTTAKYFSSLDPAFLTNINNIENPWTLRHQCEFWIGSKNPKYFNFYTSNKNKYVNTVELEEYSAYIDNPNRR